MPAQYYVTVSRTITVLLMYLDRKLMLLLQRIKAMKLHGAGKKGIGNPR